MTAPWWREAADAGPWDLAQRWLPVPRGVVAAQRRHEVAASRLACAIERVDARAPGAASDPLARRLTLRLSDELPEQILYVLRTEPTLEGSWLDLRDGSTGDCLAPGFWGWRESIAAVTDRLAADPAWRRPPARTESPPQRVDQAKLAALPLTDLIALACTGDLAHAVSLATWPRCPSAVLCELVQRDEPDLWHGVVTRRRPRGPGAMPPPDEEPLTPVLRALLAAHPRSIWLVLSHPDAPESLRHLL